MPTPEPVTPVVADRLGELLFLGYLLLIVLEYLGIPNEFPILKAVRFTTVLSYSLVFATVARAGTGDLFEHRQTQIFLAFIGLTCLAVLHAYVRLNAFNSIRPLVDGFVFFLLTLVLVDRRSRIDRLAWTLAAVAGVLVLRNFEKLGSEMRVGSFKAGYFLGDGNDFAWALNVIFPICLALVFGRRSLLKKALALGGVGICILGIVGTQSRGGTVGLAAAVLFYWLAVSKRKAVGALALLVLVAGVWVIAPNGYFARMKSVEDYEEDNSAQMRLKAWGAAISMASQHPLGVGAGNFNSAFGREYRPADGSWGSLRWLSAHSIYFKVLGEYGFPGAALLLWLIVRNLIDALRARRLLAAAGGAAAVPEYWPALLTMSIIGHAVSGIFLSGFSYPHLFFLAGLTISATRLAAQSELLARDEAPSRTAPVRSVGSQLLDGRSLGARVGARVRR